MRDTRTVAAPRCPETPLPGRRTLRDTVRAARAGHEAQAFLSALLGRMAAGHPGRGAVAETVALVRAEWLRDVGAMCRQEAGTEAELLLKAAMASRLIQRDESDDVVGGPALALAASLVDDLLAGLSPG